jgi:hypothetical protein
VKQKRIKAVTEAKTARYSTASMDGRRIEED